MNMRVLIDIAHPAHIHYFRNFAKVFEGKGHTCLFTVRDKGIILELAKHYNLNYSIRSKEHKSKIRYMLSAMLNIYKIAKKFKPDIFLDMGTIVASPVAKLLGKPYIAFDDTEVSTKARMLHMPFTNYILTPEYFNIHLGKKHLKFNGLMELMYLHPIYYKPSKFVFTQDASETNGFVLLRFVSWEAHHDVDQKGITYDNKIKLVNYLLSRFQVFISSESELPSELKRYKLSTPVHKIHDVISSARFIITEGATMASESVLLGTPALYINSIQNGNTQHQVSLGLLFSLKNDKDLFLIVKSLVELVYNNNSVIEYKEKQKEFTRNLIDPTAYLVWFIENYPKSAKIMKENPDYQYRFK